MSVSFFRYLPFPASILTEAIKALPQIEEAGNMSKKPRKGETLPNSAYKSSPFGWNVILAQLEMYKMATVMTEIDIHSMIIFSIFSRSQSRFVYFRTYDTLFETIWYMCKSKALEKK